MNKQSFDAHIARICRLVDERNKHLIPAKWADANILLDDAIDALWSGINE